MTQKRMGCILSLTGFLSFCSVSWATLTVDIQKGSDYFTLSWDPHNHAEYAIVEIWAKIAPLYNICVHYADAAIVEGDAGIWTNSSLGPNTTHPLSIPLSSQSCPDCGYRVVEYDDSDEPLEGRASDLICVTTYHSYKVAINELVEDYWRDSDVENVDEGWSGSDGDTVYANAMNDNEEVTYGLANPDFPDDTDGYNVIFSFYGWKEDPNSPTILNLLTRASLLTGTPTVLNPSYSSFALGTSGAIYSVEYAASFTETQAQDLKVHFKTQEMHANDLYEIDTAWLEIYVED